MCAIGRHCFSAAEQFIGRVGIEHGAACAGAIIGSAQLWTILTITGDLVAFEQQNSKAVGDLFRALNAIARRIIFNRQGEIAFAQLAADRRFAGKPIVARAAPSRIPFEIAANAACLVQVRHEIEHLSGQTGDTQCRPVNDLDPDDVGGGNPT